MPTANPFWDFSLAVYRKPAVADACLRLQDGVGLDVNLLLYCCWIATVREALLTEPEIREVIALTGEWRSRVVSPLRELRRGLKQGVDGLPGDSVESFRSEVKRLELASERLQQDMLFGWTEAATVSRTGNPAAAQAKEENILRYLAVMKVDRTKAVLDDCRCVATEDAQPEC